MNAIWQHSEWPQFTFQENVLQASLYQYATVANGLVGRLSGIRSDDKSEALIDLMVTEAIRSSQIEGEQYARDDVRSSIRNQLGLTSSPELVRDPRAHGISFLMVAARETFCETLTQERLFQWHDSIMTDTYLRKRVVVGGYRDDDMEIVSGPMGQEKVHFRAPPPERVPGEMDAFIDWFNRTRPNETNIILPGPVRAAVSHLYFETIHPFADGNGRIGRAIAEMALSQELASPALLSLSAVLHRRRNEYYEQLHRASHGDLNITTWVHWFVDVVLEAQLEARELILFVLAKARFWETYQSELNSRQNLVIQRMLQEGPTGFTGGMSAKKYVGLTGCSKATATRDLSELAARGLFQKLPGSGRNTRYALDLPGVE